MKRIKANKPGRYARKTPSEPQVVFTTKGEEQDLEDYMVDRIVELKGGKEVEIKIEDDIILSDNADTDDDDDIILSDSADTDDDDDDDDEGWGKDDETKENPKK